MTLGTISGSVFVEDVTREVVDEKIYEPPHPDEIHPETCLELLRVCGRDLVMRDMDGRFLYQFSTRIGLDVEKVTTYGCILGAVGHENIFYTELGTVDDLEDDLDD